MIKVFSFVIQPEHERKAYAIKYIRGENISGLKYAMLCEFSQK